MARGVEVAARVDQLVADFRRYVDIYDGDPAFAVMQRDKHRITIAARRAAGTVHGAVDDQQFLTALHRTLVAWRIGVRGSRLAPITEFTQALRTAAPAVTELESFRIGDADLPNDIADRLWDVLDSLNVVDNKAKIVAGTKTLHHLLPDLVPPMDRAWTGKFFLLHPPEWQTSQRLTFRRVYSHFVDIAQRASPERYVTGEGWRTSRTKILDNAIIGFCKTELSQPAPEAIEPGRLISFSVNGLPPAKSEALSMLGPDHPHAQRVRLLLESARQATLEQGFVPVENERVALDLVVHSQPGARTSDATNFLGGVGDVLENKEARGVLPHLGHLGYVWLYRNDRQIKDISFKEIWSGQTSYTVTIRVVDDHTSST